MFEDMNISPNQRWIERGMSRSAQCQFQRQRRLVHVAQVRRSTRA